jgi:hypothetical protein
MSQGRQEINNPIPASNTGSQFFPYLSCFLNNGTFFYLVVPKPALKLFVLDHRLDFFKNNIGRVPDS